MRGQRQQARLFFSEDFDHGAPIVARPGALMGHLIPPQQGLTVALFQRGEAAAGPEGFTHITNRPFHAALLVSGAHLARARHAVIVSAQLHQARMEVDLIATPLQYRTAQIIMQDDSRNTRPGFEGVHMAAKEVLHALVEKELQIQRSRPGKRDHEAGQATTGSPYGDFAEMRPVDLSLLGLKHVQAQERLYSPGAQIGNDAAQLKHTAHIATVANHLEDARSAKLWILVQSLADEGQVSTVGRFVTGLGAASVLETGIRLHHTYGTPIIPGSGLKGLAAHYCHSVWGECDPEFSASVPEGKKTRPGSHFHVLFGDLKAAGLIIFHDAWMLPDDLVGPSPNRGLVPDVMTPHHSKYGIGRQVPPSDFDSPVPVPFLSVSGQFLLAVSPNAGGNGTDHWVQLASKLLKEALRSWGAGGKTRSGYGRFSAPEVQ